MIYDERILDFLNACSYLSNLVNLKITATDMRYFARSKFSRSLVHQKNFRLI